MSSDKYCKSLNAEADMRIQLSSIKPETCKTVKILNNLFIKETTEIMIFFY